MSLHKDRTVSIIPGNPGVEPIHGAMGRSAYFSTKKTTVIVYSGTAGWDWFLYGYISLSMVSGYFAAYIPTAIQATIIEKNITTYHPAVQRTPGTTGVPPTAGQIITGLNVGWDTWSRSIDKIDTDKYLIYTVANGVSCVFVGIGPNGVGGQKISSYKHGIIVDTTGIHIFESGSIVLTIRNNHTSESYIRIVRQIDNSIVYVVTTGTETIVHVSGAATHSKFMPLYAYAYIYTSGDVIISSEIKTGEVLFGEG